MDGWMGRDRDGEAGRAKTSLSLSLSLSARGVESPDSLARTIQALLSSHLPPQTRERTVTQPGGRTGGQDGGGGVPQAAAQSREHKARSYSRVWRGGIITATADVSLDVW